MLKMPDLAKWEDDEMKLMSPEIVSSVGLFFDAVGVILIWKFSLGWGIKIKTEDGTAIQIPGGNRKKAPLYKILDYAGVVLLVIGFLLQIWSNWIPSGGATFRE